MPQDEDQEEPEKPVKIDPGKMVEVNKHKPDVRDRQADGDKPTP